MERDSEKLLRPWKVLKQYKYPLLVALLGAVLLMWSGREGQPHTGAELSGTGAVESGRVDETLELEERMEEILEKVQGVGQVKVMLTMHSGPEKVLAQDQSVRYSGATQAPDDYDRSGETVVLSMGSGGEEVVVTQERFGQCRGALVVCQGGGSDAVRLQVVAAVSALTGLGSDRIAVMKWSGGTGDGGKGTEN